LKHFIAGKKQCYERNEYKLIGKKVADGPVKEGVIQFRVVWYYIF